MSVVRTLAWCFHILEMSSIHTGEYTNNNVLNPSAERTRTAKIALHFTERPLTTALLSLVFSLEATRSFIPSLMILDHTSFKVRPRTDDKDVSQDSFCFSGFSSGVARIFPEVRPTFLHRLPHPLHPKSQHFFKLPLLKVRLTVVSQRILLFIKCHNL